MITKRKDGWYVVSHTTGRNLGGPYNDKAQAERRLKQVRAFKYMKKAEFIYATLCRQQDERSNIP